MCLNCGLDTPSRSRKRESSEVKNGDHSCLLSCAAAPQVSNVSIMSENPAPNFVYFRRKEKAKSDNLSSEEVPAITKRSRDDCNSIISSEAPLVSNGGIHVSSQNERTNENPLKPSIAANMEPAVFTLKSVDGVSLVKAQGGRNIVYRRKKPQCRYATVISPEVPCLSVLSSDSPSDAIKELHVASQSYHTHSYPFVPSIGCKRENCVPKSESIKECFAVEENETDEASRRTWLKVIEVDSINDSCSSSKSDAELVSASMQTEANDSVECSSSSLMGTEVMEEGTSEKDLCISIIRSQGLLHKISPSKNCASANGVGDSNASSSLRLCKICTSQESSLKMLICDNCEEAFHLHCCNPRIKRIPLDEWFCHSCSKKRCKILKESASTCLTGKSGKCGSSFTEEPNPIALMLRDSGPYTSAVRCGKGFQAEVPVWSGPITTDTDTIPESMEMNPADFACSTELNLNKRSKLSSIGNWLQCREVIDGTGESVGATICGKWRRAPLFEVQTDKWDCFSSVLWDPAHADCAVPQEVDTDEVVKQLKYIHMLKSRLSAKCGRLEHRKNGNGLIEAVRQQRKEQSYSEQQTKMYRRFTHGRKKDKQK